MSFGSFLSQLDPTRRNSAVSRVTRVVATGGLSLAPRGTIANRVATGLDNAARDTSRVGVIPFTAAGTLMGVKGARARLNTDLAAVRRQLPVVQAGVKGFMTGGPWGAAIAGGAAIGANYVAPEFASRAPDVYAPSDVAGYVPAQGSLANLPTGSTPGQGSTPSSGAGPLILAAAAAALLL